MSTSKELGEASDGYQTEIKQLKAHILTLKETIRIVKRKVMRRQQREKTKREADLDILCQQCQIYLKTL